MIIIGLILIVLLVLVAIWLLPAIIMGVAAVVAVIAGIWRGLFPQRVKAQHAARNRVPLVERMRADSERMKAERLAKKAAKKAAKA
jgi:uncharacterized protein involved in cysteine biosynthesis